MSSHCARDGPLGRAPCTDMYHVNAQDRSRLADAPIEFSRVNLQRREALASAAWIRQASIEANEVRGQVLEDHVSLGKSEAKWTACSPLPLASSRMSPCSGSTSRNTAAIASRLRCVAGAYLRLSTRSSSVGAGAGDRVFIATAPTSVRASRIRRNYFRPIS